jgi:signal peptidase
MKNLFQKLILIILLITLIYVVYVKYIAKESLVKINGYSFLIVLTGSMEPDIKAGDFVIIKECDDYAIYDVITYEDEDMLVTHRIIQKTSDVVITKGDANNTEDDEINYNQILGKVVYSSEKIGKFIRVYLKYIFLIISLFVIIINVCVSNGERKKDGEGEN